VFLGLRQPRLALCPGNRGGHRLQRQAHVGLYADDAGVVPAELRRVEIDVDDARAFLRYLPVCGGLVARVAAGVDDEVGFRDDVVRAASPVAAERAAEERMVFAHDRLGVERGDDRRLDLLGEPRQRFPRAADLCGVLGDDHRPGCGLDGGRRLLHRFRVRSGPESGVARVRFVHDDVEHPLIGRRSHRRYSRPCRCAPGAVCPVVASRNACRSTCGICSTKSTRPCHLVTDWYSGSCGSSW
jgi:hypothetical protein